MQYPPTEVPETDRPYKNLFQDIDDLVIEIREHINELIEETYKKCKYCHNGTLDYKKITTWFTIFFIPLIPYKKEYYLMCNNCERGYELEGELEK